VGVGPLFQSSFGCSDVMLGGCVVFYSCPVYCILLQAGAIEGARVFVSAVA